MEVTYGTSFISDNTTWPTFLQVHHRLIRMPYSPARGAPCQPAASNGELTES